MKIMLLVALLVSSAINGLYIYRYVKMKKMIVGMIEYSLKIEQYINVLEDEKAKDENNIHKENFIKFLSDSRDYAYDYIENVQLGLNKFINEVEPSLMYFDAYGDAGPLGPNYDALKNISKHFVELKKLLPEEEK